MRSVMLPINEYDDDDDDDEVRVLTPSVGRTSNHMISSLVCGL